jgi:hypothetical protein
LSVAEKGIIANVATALTEAGRRRRGGSCNELLSVTDKAVVRVE